MKLVLKKGLAHRWWKFPIE